MSDKPKMSEILKAAAAGLTEPRAAYYRRMTPGRVYHVNERREKQWEQDASTASMLMAVAKCFEAYEAPPTPPEPRAPKGDSHDE